MPNYHGRCRQGRSTRVPGRLLSSSRNGRAIRYRVLQHDSWRRSLGRGRRGCAGAASQGGTLPGADCGGNRCLLGCARARCARAHTRHCHRCRVIRCAPLLRVVMCCLAHSWLAPLAVHVWCTRHCHRCWVIRCAPCYAWGDCCDVLLAHSCLASLAVHACTLGIVIGVGSSGAPPAVLVVYCRDFHRKNTAAARPCNTNLTGTAWAQTSTGEQSCMVGQSGRYVHMGACMHCARGVQMCQVDPLALSVPVLQVRLRRSGTT